MIYKLKVNNLKSDSKKYVEVVAPDREVLGHYFWDVVQYEMRSEEFVPSSYEIIDIISEDAVDFVVEEKISLDFLDKTDVEIDDTLEYLADLPVSDFIETMIEILVG